MNKKVFIEKVAARMETTQGEASKAVEAVLESLKDGLATEGKVSFVGFGNFEVRERAERTGKNPRTGEEMLIPASKTVKFKAGKGLLENIK